MITINDECFVYYDYRTAGCTSTATLWNLAEWNVLLIHTSLLLQYSQVRLNQSFLLLNTNLMFESILLFTRDRLSPKKNLFHLFCQIFFFFVLFCFKLNRPLCFQWRTVEKCHTLSRLPAVNFPKCQIFLWVVSKPKFFQLSKVWLIIAISHYRSFLPEKTWIRKVLNE